MKPLLNSNNGADITASQSGTVTGSLPGEVLWTY